MPLVRRLWAKVFGRLARYAPWSIAPDCGGAVLMAQCGRPNGGPDRELGLLFRRPRARRALPAQGACGIELLGYRTVGGLMEELTTTFLACWRTTWLNPFMIIIVLIGKDLVLEGLRLSQVPGICPPLFFRTKNHAQDGNGAHLH